MRAVLRDPLFHFTVAAALIFAAFQLSSAHRAQAEATIFVSQSDMERMAALYAVEAGAPPGAGEMRAMVADHVRREALVREARKLGLDAGDTVVERRLEQKMAFLAADLDDIPPPDDATLRDWRKAHADRFIRPPQASFDHVFFRDAEDPRIDEALAALNGDAPPDWRALGDPFMLQRQYGLLPKREIERIFGGGFADAVFALEASEHWQGPVDSALGAHLVRMPRLDPEFDPPFEAVRKAVLSDWTEAERRRRNEEAVSDIIARYTVEIEGAGE